MFHLSNRYSPPKMSRIDPSLPPNKDRMLEGFGTDIVPVFPTFVKKVKGVEGTEKFFRYDIAAEAEPASAGKSFTMEPDVS